MISASRGAAVPSRHRCDSCLSDEAVGGFFFDFEPFRTVSMLRAGQQRRDDGALALPARGFTNARRGPRGFEICAIIKVGPQDL